ncbi:SDR family NAD(P)-dependent oxidoreductase [Sansalvadorimonas sp. 2012CJ34-2]|uniref:SDR family NAD(P)-dependent oxidoreductase n=1 Tax=Parendozoicomonas callyspongiae TaxID=2942213 RepID=A0ABT0PHV6_9GAMM|nr:SDR family NAD(P)-dependent oxidoreductase [Sansalvadorimonas sp. 2012CJ34-2]MCL6270826.1 SDR family NAD(P)-dependent oxidoreductase [Sansalvadorimonas sp. 2012CJ34-2]
MNKKVVWITGASQGIGKALAWAMAEQGTHVVASARSRENLEQLAQESSNLSGCIEPLPLDVTDAQACSQAIMQIMNKHGQLDQAVLNAGTFFPMKGNEFRAETVRRQMDINVMGVCNCLEPVIEVMKKQGRGVIAINASLSGYRGLPKAAAYGASKAALINMAECLKLELHGNGIDVKVINPGFVKTPLTDKNKFPMPFLTPADKAAQAIIKGLSRSGFEIRFPFIFASLLHLMKILPYCMYFFLMGRAN